MLLKLVPMLLALCMQPALAENANEALVNCFSSIKNDLELQPITDKVSLSSSRDQTFSMLANEKRTTAREKQIIAKWGEKRELCLKTYTPVDGPYNQISLNAFKATQSLILDLFKGQLSYGQFARKRQDVDDKLSAEAQVIANQLQQKQQEQQRQVQQQQQYEQQQRQAQQQLYEQQQQAQQQQQYEQQQRARQYCENSYQQCLNRARNNFDQSACQMQNAGCGLGNVIGNQMSR